MASPVDAHGRIIKSGDLVRIVGVPDLSTLPKDAQKQTLFVFMHIKGHCKRIDEINKYGHAEFNFKIRKGPLQGRHFISIEPNLLVKQDPAKNIA